MSTAGEPCGCDESLALRAEVERLRVESNVRDLMRELPEDRRIEVLERIALWVGDALSAPCEVCKGTGGVTAYMTGRDHWHPCPRGCVAKGARDKEGA